MLTRFSLTAKLALGFGIVILLLLAVGSVGIFEIQTLRTINQNMFQHPFTVSNTVRKLDADIIRMHLTMKDLVLAQNPAEMEHSIALVDRLEAKVFEGFKVVGARFLGDPAMVQQALTHVQEWRPIRDEVIALIREGKPSEAADITKGKGAVHVDRISESMRELSDFAQSKAIQFNHEADHTGWLLIVFLSVLTIVSIVGSIFLTSTITRSITVPAYEIVEVSEAIARGDFSKTITYTSKDEIGEMANSLRHMLSGVVGKGQSIINSIPVHFWTTDKNLNITFINDLAANAVGLPTTSGGQRDSEPLTVADDLRDDEEITLSLAQRSLSTGRRMMHDVHFTRNDKVLHLHLVTSPLRDTNDEIAGVMGFALDITRHKEIEDELRIAIDAATRARRVKGEFLANMSHEIRTPLSGIHGMLRLLEGSNLDEEQKRWISMAMASGQNLLTVINDILDLSRLEAGRLELANEPFILTNSLETVINNFQLLAQTKGIGLRYELDPGIPQQIGGDDIRLRQVLFNLVDNAVKFTPKGEVVLKTFLYEEHPEALTLGFTVSDTGIGIPKDQQKDLFTEFVQVSFTPSRPYQGSGLGLAITKQLVTLMRGDIAVDSTPRLGTIVRFTARFDKVQSAAAQAPVTQGQVSSPGNLRILLAEDDRINQLALVTMLRQAGHEVLAVDNGQEAVEAFQQADYDCIFMDIQMPQMNGLEATRIIREQHSADIPIIALTAHAMKGDRESFLSQGLSDYVAKPVMPDELNEALSRVTPRSRA
ncbi:MAG: response regulator [Proteobacteria bacterium]|nr:response regulator [Pseudomonadota bacterium]